MWPVFDGILYCNSKDIILLHTVCVLDLVLSPWRKRSHRAAKDETWVTGKQMPATVSTADTAKNNLKNWQKFTPKCPTDTSSREIIRSKIKTRYRRRGQDWREEEHLVLLEPMSEKKPCHMTGKTNKEKQNERGRNQGKCWHIPEGTTCSSSGFTEVFDCSVNKSCVWSESLFSANTEPILEGWVTLKRSMYKW